MKKSVLTALVALFFAVSFAQETTKAGHSTSIIHPTMEHALKNEGIYPDAAQMVWANSYKGNNYAASYIVERLSLKGKFKNFRKVVKNSWGISYQGVLYVNINPSVGSTFTKSWTAGRYLLFFIPPPANTQKQDELGVPQDISEKQKKATDTKSAALYTGVMFGVVGVLVGNAIGNAFTKTYVIPVVIDTEKVTTRCFSPEYAVELNEEYPDINAPKPNSDGEYNSELLFKYFDAVNAQAEL